MLKLQDLKAEARSSREMLNLLDGTKLTAEAFQVAMRKFGDLRHRSTWERICIQLEGLWLLKGLENCDLIRTLAAPDTPIAQAYPAELLDAVLAHPSGLAQVENGLQRLHANSLARAIAPVQCSFSGIFLDIKPLIWIFLPLHCKRLDFRRSQLRAAGIAGQSGQAETAQSAAWAIAAPA